MVLKNGCLTDHEIFDNTTVIIAYHRRDMMCKFPLFRCIFRRVHVELASSHYVPHNLDRSSHYCTLSSTIVLTTFHASRNPFRCHCEHCISAVEYHGIRALGIGRGGGGSDGSCDEKFEDFSNECPPVRLMSNGIAPHMYMWERACCFFGDTTCLTLFGDFIASYFYRLGVLKFS